jgi:hypothetical protein
MLLFQPKAAEREFTRKTKQNKVFLPKAAEREFTHT